MKYNLFKIIAVITLFSVFPCLLKGQTISRDVIPAAAGFFSAANGSLSWTMGETFQKTLSAPNTILTQGFQQPEAANVTLELTLFIEGYYQGGGTQIASVDPVNYPTLSDTITIELASKDIPYSILQSKKTTLSTAGFASVSFPGLVQGFQYFVVVRHRNSLQTWSATPVSLALPKANYNFSLVSSSAFGGNLAPLFDGRYGIWSGDVNQDGLVESTDYSDVENASQIFLSGYELTDLTGDGLVESADYSLIENNSQLFLIYSTP